MKKIKRALIYEKIPTVVCMAACAASVLMGFVLGYVFLDSGGYSIAHANTAPVYHEPYRAVIYTEAPTPETVPVYTPPQQYEEQDSHLFVVTAIDGYLVIYHAERYGGGIKDITGLTVDALPPEELEQLAQGIRVYSDEALVRLLQDYGS